MWYSVITCYFVFSCKLSSYLIIILINYKGYFVIETNLVSFLFQKSYILIIVRRLLIEV